MKLLFKEHGKGSFPGKAEAYKHKAEAEKLSQKPKFSILVPLYNTPKKYLKEMIESVLEQTYGNWGLCLADASDDVYAYVKSIVRKYQAKDTNNLIKYCRL